MLKYEDAVVVFAKEQSGAVVEADDLMVLGVQKN
jgi:hypothetical protein